MYFEIGTFHKCILKSFEKKFNQRGGNFFVENIFLFRLTFAAWSKRVYKRNEATY